MFGGLTMFLYLWSVTRKENIIKQLKAFKTMAKVIANWGYRKQHR